jgi:membrane protein
MDPAESVRQGGERIRMIAALISKLIKYLTIDIWRIRSRELPRSRSFWVKFLRVVILSVRGITEDKGYLRASALTFYSLLSIVPVFAMLFGIAKGFGFEKTLESQLMEKLGGQEEIFNRIVTFSHTLLENTQGGVIAGIGLAVLFWSIIKLLGNIEDAFNHIWGVKKQRSVGRQISDYLSIMLIAPVLFLMSSGMTILVTSKVKVIIKEIDITGVIGPVVIYLLKFTPYLTIWLLFTFLYMFMPNTKVHFRSGVLAGIVAGSMYQVFQWIYINFQIGVARYNAIYGSFAALPLFLVWLQLSWLIVLLGAEISFATQNVDTYEFEPDCLRISHAFKRLLSLRVAHLLVQEFSQGDRTWTEWRISQKLEIPIRLVRQILFELLESGIVSQVKTESETEGAFQPARITDKLTIKYVIDALEGRGSDDIPVARSEDLERISGSLKSFDEMIKNSPANRPLKDL